jgi:hypothetical protein
MNGILLVARICLAMEKTGVSIAGPKPSDPTTLLSFDLEEHSEAKSAGLQGTAQGGLLRRERSMVLRHIKL